VCTTAGWEAEFGDAVQGNGEVPLGREIGERYGGG
jgi:hypothetical protein